MAISAQAISLEMALWKTALRLSISESRDLMKNDSDEELQREVALIGERIHSPRGVFAVRSLSDCLPSRFHFTVVLTPNAGDNRRAVACNASETLVCASG